MCLCICLNNCLDLNLMVAKSCTQFCEYIFFDVRRNGLEKIFFLNSVSIYANRLAAHSSCLSPTNGRQMCAQKTTPLNLARRHSAFSLTLRPANQRQCEPTCLCTYAAVSVSVSGRSKRSSCKCVRAPSEVRKNIGACVCLAFKLPLFSSRADFSCRLPGSVCFLLLFPRPTINFCRFCSTRFGCLKLKAWH